MEPYSYYKQYSLIGIKRHGRKPSKRDLPEEFVKLMEQMGFEIEDSPKWMGNCIGISRGIGTEYFARFDFKEGILIAREEEKLDRIKTLGLEELALRSVSFHIPDTYWGGSMKYQSEIAERIPRFRNHLKDNSFLVDTVSKGPPKVKKLFSKKISGELWGGCIEVYPNEPWGEELYRLCLDYK